mgnify:CR=1 FL=1
MLGGLRIVQKSAEIKDYYINHLHKSLAARKSGWKQKLLKLIPSRDRIENHAICKRCSPLLNKSPNYWHLNEASVCRAVAIGLFCAFIVIPFQTITAIILAIIFRSNLPLSVSIIWINNPLTITPIYYLCYLVGATVLRVPMIKNIHFNNIASDLHALWQPFLLGTFLCGLVACVLGYLCARLCWILFKR